VVVTRFNEPQNFLTARIVAVDTNNDLAMLQIMAPGPFPTASLADSSLTEVGDWVIAVGNPFGLEHTVTAGIISARRSSIAIDSMVYNGLIQTDAPINRGSSGGPLCNLQGRVIGINTAIYAPTGVFNGTGFAIPSNRVSAFVAKVLSNPAATAGLPVALLGSHMTTRALQATAVQQVAMQPQQMMAQAQPGMQTQPGLQQGPPSIWLGIGVVDMTPDLAKRLGYPFAGGVFVNSVILDSPADEAQFTRGDILTSAGGVAIANADTLNQVFATMKPGVPVIVTFWRGGKTETTQLTPQASRPIGR
jgi:serine protease Do